MKEKRRKRRRKKKGKKNKIKKKGKEKQKSLEEGGDGGNVEFHNTIIVNFSSLEPPLTLAKFNMLGSSQCLSKARNKEG
jgi:hypothetical protein